MFGKHLIDVILVLRDEGNTTGYVMAEINGVELGM
jgi:hypothetical protein